MSIYPSNGKLVNSEDPLMAATGVVRTRRHELAEDVFSRIMLCLLWRSSSACSKRSMSLICEITFSIEGMMIKVAPIHRCSFRTNFTNANSSSLLMIVENLDPMIRGAG